jgi:hypothetical protein
MAIKHLPSDERTSALILLTGSILSGIEQSERTGITEIQCRHAVDLAEYTLEIIEWKVQKP